MRDRCGIAPAINTTLLPSCDLLITATIDGQDSADYFSDQFFYEDILSDFPLTTDVIETITTKKESNFPQSCYISLHPLDSPQSPLSSHEQNTVGYTNQSEKRRLQVKEASKRCRQRQKDELSFLRRRVCELQESVYQLQARINPPEQTVWEGEARTRAAECAILMRENDLIQEKLVQHKEWSRRLTDLLAVAPLRSFTLGTGLNIFDTNNTSLEEHDLMNECFLRKHGSEALENLQNLVLEILHPSCQYTFKREENGWIIRAETCVSLHVFHAIHSFEKNLDIKQLAADLWKYSIDEKNINLLFPFLQRWKLHKEVDNHIKVYSVSSKDNQIVMEILLVMEQVKENKWILVIEDLYSSNCNQDSRAASTYPAVLIGGAILRKEKNDITIEFVGVYEINANNKNYGKVEDVANFLFVVLKQLEFLT